MSLLKAVLVALILVIAPASTGAVADDGFPMPILPDTLR